MIHELKVSTDDFNAVISGRKSFEIWTNDRPYKVGDILALNEYADDGYGKHLGNSCLVYVDYLEPFNDLVIMAIKPCTVYKHTEPINLNKLTRDYCVPLATQEGDADV